jgi:nitroreductase
MKHALDAASLDTLFRNARSYNRWSSEPVPETTLHALYDLLKFGPTSVNCCPAKAKLVPCLSPGNVVKVEQAPVVVIVGMDEKFYEQIPKLFPNRPDAGGMFKDPAVGNVHMFRNGTLQGAYLIMAARALGLDCGPMSGFQNAKVDEEFFAGTSIKSNFLCALGVGTTEHLYPRNPRLDFTEACKII